MPPKPGQRIYKGHASYGLMRELQLGIMFSIAQAGQVGMQQHGSPPRYESGISQPGDQHISKAQLGEQAGQAGAASCAAGGGWECGWGSGVQLGVCRWGVAGSVQAVQLGAVKDPLQTQQALVVGRYGLGRPTIATSLQLHRSWKWH